MKEKPWIAWTFLAGTSLAFLLAVTVVIPREPGRLEPGREGSFGYSFDPHLILTVNETALEIDSLGESNFVMHVVARNTAAEDLEVDLSSLRLTLLSSDERSVEVVTPDWNEGRGGVTSLLPSSSAEAVIRFELESKDSTLAILIWQHYAILDYLPVARGSILCPSLRFEIEVASLPRRGVGSRAQEPALGDKKP